MLTDFQNSHCCILQ